MTDHSDHLPTARGRRVKYYKECDIIVNIRFVLTGRFTSAHDGYQIVRDLLDNTRNDEIEVDGTQVRWYPASWDYHSSYVTQPTYQSEHPDAGTH